MLLHTYCTLIMKKISLQDAIKQGMAPDKLQSNAQQTANQDPSPNVQRAGHTMPEAASHLAGTATERLDAPSAAAAAASSCAAAHMAVETLGMPSATAGTVSSSAASPLDFAAWHSLAVAIQTKSKPWVVEVKSADACNPRMIFCDS
jgi:hypothetical protein